MRIVDEIERGTETIQQANSTLEAFVFVYANADKDGHQLYQSEDAKEILLFQVWLKACSDLGIAPPPVPHPSRTGR